MKITKRQLKRIIREATGDTGGANANTIKKGLAIAFPDWGSDIEGLELKSAVVDEFASMVQNAMKAAASGDLVQAEKMSDRAAKQMEGRMKIKLTKNQLKKIIKEEKLKLMSEQAGGYQRGSGELGAVPDQLEQSLGMELREFFEQWVGAESYEGTGPDWENEIMRAAAQLEHEVIDSGLFSDIIRMWSVIEEKLHNGEYA